MCVRFSPKDPSIFASCSMDASVKIWNVGSNKPNITLQDHKSGVSSVDLHAVQNLLVSGSDDHTIKLWDYQERKCIFTLTEHTEGVTSVLFHPQLHCIFSASEDGQVIIWNMNNYKSSQTLSYYMQKCWSIRINNNRPGILALGYDEGTLVVKLGGDDRRASLK